LSEKRRLRRERGFKTGFRQPRQDRRQMPRPTYPAGLTRSTSYQIARALFSGPVSESATEKTDWMRERKDSACIRRMIRLGDWLTARPDRQAWGRVELSDLEKARRRDLMRRAFLMPKQQRLMFGRIRQVSRSHGPRPLRARGSRRSSSTRNSRAAPGDSDGSDSDPPASARHNAVVAQRGPS
jgi:hypothetical protein